MDVILLSGNSPQRSVFLQRNIGAYKLAYYLRKNNLSCQVIEYIAYLNSEQIYLAMKKFITDSTSVIGLSTSFISSDYYRHSDGRSYKLPERIIIALRQIKLEHPTIKIVMGGYNSDVIPNFGVFDAVLMSYQLSNDDLLLEYVRDVKSNEINLTPQKTLKPITQYCKEIPFYTTPKNIIYNIESDDFKFSKQDVILPNEPLPLDMSKGCIFSCKFCRFLFLGKTKLDYIRNMELIKEELFYNYNTFGTTTYYMLDDTFNDTEWKLTEFHKVVSSLPFKINFVAYIRADLIHRFPQTAAILQESGLIGAQHGIETLHVDASKMIGKAWSGKHAREFIPHLYHNLWNNKINQHMSFIVGFPQESKQDIFDTIKWFVDNELDSSMFFPLNIRKVPGIASSEFDRNSQKYGFSWIQNHKGEEEWINDQWSYSSASEFSEIIKTEVRKYNRANSWDIPGFLWYGHSKTDVLTKKYKEYDISLINQKTKIFLQLYYEKLMSL